MSEKDLKIKNLSKFRYRELKNICLQYKEMKEEARHLPYSGVKAVEISDMPTTHNMRDTTAEIAIKLAKLKQRIEAIEQAAIEADSKMYMAIITNVTEGIPPRYLYIDCPEKTFYNKRRKFFDILDKKI